MRKQRGMTLLEVMVALAIFAYAAMSLFSITTQHLRSQEYLQTKSFAHWVAQNKLVDLTLTKTESDKATRKGTEEFAGQKWFWQAEVLDNAGMMLKTLRVSVREHEKDPDPIATVQTFIASGEQR